MAARSICGCCGGVSRRRWTHARDLFTSGNSMMIRAEGGGGGLQRRSIARRPMPNVENGAAVRRSDGISGQHHDPSGRRIFSLTNPNIQTWWSPERGTDRWWCDAARGRVSTPRPSGSHGWIDYCSTLVLSACRKRMHPRARREWCIGINKIPRSVGWHDCGGIVLMLRKFSLRSWPHAMYMIITLSCVE